MMVSTRFMLKKTSLLASSVKAVPWKKPNMTFWEPLRLSAKTISNEPVKKWRLSLNSFMTLRLFYNITRVFLPFRASHESLELTKFNSHNTSVEGGILHKKHNKKSKPR